MNNRKDVPNCCLGCDNLESDYSEMTDTTWYFCRLNLIFPVKKNNCKKSTDGESHIDANGVEITKKIEEA